jgi:YD repeat-containing protein
VAKNFYNDDGQLVAVQDANGNLTQFIQNLTNSEEVVIDRLGNTNSYVYDSLGNVIIQTNAVGQVTTMAYDANNNQTNEVMYLNGQPYSTNSYMEMERHTPCAGQSMPSPTSVTAPCPQT